MTRLSVCSLGVSCNEMIDTPMLLVVQRIGGIAFESGQEAPCNDGSKTHKTSMFWFWFINQQDSLTDMFADVLA